MAFYTAEYIRQLAKEDHARIQKTINLKDGSFRRYIDATLPFSLYINLDSLVENVVNEGSAFVKLAASVCEVDSDFIVKQLIETYKRVILHYHNTYTNITSEELGNKLADFQDAVYSDAPILPVLKREFSKTLVISNIGKNKKDREVLIIAPSFYAIQTGFSKLFKDLFNYNVFSTSTQPPKLSPRDRMENLLAKNFGLLQNLGHIEVDVISSTDNEVKRGLVTPKLLSAILELPKGVDPSKLARTFSDYTGQASTRVIVRKKFSDSKLIMEMLVETGFLFGSIESRAQNLGKSGKENSFNFGKSIDSIIRNDPNFLTNLSTSTSINEFVSGTILGTLRGKKVKPYNSNSSIVTNTKIKQTKVKVDTKVKKPRTPVVPRYTTDSVIPSSYNLLAILQSKINEQVRQNMGTGSDTKILNYRTGRFSDSVRVDRLSESRAGLITVFYSYMRNPYGTFSAGGRQQYPASRDPKLLIAGSIRQIAGGLVNNRLRSVLV
jgi:hypothetical protein